MDLNRHEASHHSGRGLRGIISDNAALYSHQSAHRFIPWGTLVAMVVRSVRLRGSRERIDGKGSIDRFGVGWPHLTADDS